MLMLCSAERALHVLGLEQERWVLHDYIETNYLSTTISVNQLRPVWQNIPKETYWSERALDCIQDGVAFINEREARGQRCYCKSRHPDYTLHVNCLANWILTDKSLQAALGTYRNSRQPTLYTGFNVGHPKTPSRTANWILAVDTVQEVYPLGKAPSQRLVARKVPVKQFKCSGKETYQLEWIGESGGYYLETQGHRKRTEFDEHETTTTSISKQWLASRGYRGGASRSVKGSLTFAYWRSEVLADAGIEYKHHRCPAWLSHDDHLICAFRYGRLHHPVLQRPQTFGAILNGHA